jgi:hypothetical protein
MLANEVMVTLLIIKGKQSIRKMQGAKYGFGPTCLVVTDAASKIRSASVRVPRGVGAKDRPLIMVLSYVLAVTIAVRTPSKSEKSFE